MDRSQSDSYHYKANGFFYSSLSQSKLFSLNHLIRPRQHVGRNRKADLLCGLEVDDQLELGRLLHRQIGGLSSLENFVNVIRDAAVAVREFRPVGHESASVRICYVTQRWQLAL